MPANFRFGAVHRRHRSRRGQVRVQDDELGFAMAPLALEVSCAGWRREVHAPLAPHACVGVLDPGDHILEDGYALVISAVMLRSIDVGAGRAWVVLKPISEFAAGQLLADALGDAHDPTSEMDSVVLRALRPVAVRGAPLRGPEWDAATRGIGLTVDGVGWEFPAREPARPDVESRVHTTATAMSCFLAGAALTMLAHLCIGRL